MQPKLIIHGGLGSGVKQAQEADKWRAALVRIAEHSFAFLRSHSALEAVIHAVSQLEDDPLFNAGTGSKLQSDGVIRMTASIMDGYRQRFAGVINIREIKNPMQVAALLLDHDDCVLAGEEALVFARQHGFAAHNPETPARRQVYEQQHKSTTGTVGCVALDVQGRLAAATSTGGKGFEMPGRVSDSGTVAGNYANAAAAVSCTGVGEHIVDAALAARIVTRVTDGMALSEACDRSIAEVTAHGGNAGVIALDANGSLYQAATEPYLAYVMHDGERIESLFMPPPPL